MTEIKHVLKEETNQIALINDEEEESKTFHNNKNEQIHKNSRSSFTNQNELISMEIHSLKSKEEQHNTELHSALSTMDADQTADGSQRDIAGFSEFIKPQHSDHIGCINGDHDLGQCNVMNRIIHLLIYYENYSDQKSLNSKSTDTTSIYEYLLSQNYDLATFMEDWHQLKNNHLRSKESVDWIKNHMDIRCNLIRECQYFRRNQRNRDNDIYNIVHAEIVDVILMDVLDSIHTFIFHNMQHQNQHQLANNVEFSDIDDKSDE
eukprot:2423_1